MENYSATGKSAIGLDQTWPLLLGIHRHSGPYQFLMRKKTVRQISRIQSVLYSLAYTIGFHCGLVSVNDTHICSAAVSES